MEEREREREREMRKGGQIQQCREILPLFIEM